jgi:hypothetical protein
MPDEGETNQIRPKPQKVFAVGVYIRCVGIAYDGVLIVHRVICDVYKAVRACKTVIGPASSALKDSIWDTPTCHNSSINVTGLRNYRIPFGRLSNSML